jgi:hypothetical protein
MTAFRTLNSGLPFTELHAIPNPCHRLCPICHEGEIRQGRLDTFDHYDRQARFVGSEEHVAMRCIQLDMWRTSFEKDSGTTAQNVLEFRTDFRTFMNQEHARILTFYIYKTMNTYQQWLHAAQRRLYG